MTTMFSLDRVLEKDLLPDPLLRLGIRRLLRARLREELRDTPDGQRHAEAEFADLMRRSPVALATAEANAQHYEVPTEFYRHCLGPRMKYSCAWWSEGIASLAQAEEAMLGLTCARAELSDGQDILELGCGWGSLSLWMATRYPNSRIVGVSNSRTQKAHIDAEIERLGLTNLEIVTCDMNRFASEPRRFDRVVSVEMFEHMRNWEVLLERIAGWLRPDGRLFVHIFTHRTASYPFDARDESDWMSRHFFTGGMMPSERLLGRFAQHLAVEREWRVSGTHYAKTARAWLENMDRNAAHVRPILERTYGAAEARKWWAYWRIFFLSCEQLWAFRGGEEWGVSHYLLAPVSACRSAEPALVGAGAG